MVQVFVPLPFSILQGDNHQLVATINATTVLLLNTNSALFRRLNGGGTRAVESESESESEGVLDRDGVEVGRNF
jgi:hypothetical protein